LRVIGDGKMKKPLKMKANDEVMTSLRLEQKGEAEIYCNFFSSKMKR
jgi:hypothetical protein